MFTLIVFLIACHFIADFPFQSDWLAANKGKSWEIMFYHCAIYTGTFLLFGKVSLMFAMILFISHFIIDPLKVKYHLIKHIWQDQLLHILVIICLVFLKV